MDTAYRNIFLMLVILYTVTWTVFPIDTVSSLLLLTFVIISVILILKNHEYYEEQLDILINKVLRKQV